MASIIYDGTPASFPHSFEYTPERDTPGLINLSGSAWTSSTNSKIGLTLAIDGKQVTEATFFSNGPTTHRALNAGLAEYTFQVKIENGQISPVQITIGKLNRTTIFDVNDRVSVTLH